MRKAMIATGLLSVSLYIAAFCSATSAAPHKYRSIDPNFGYNPGLAYLYALAGLQKGDKAEFIAGRNALRAIATSHVGYQSGMDPIRATTIQSSQNDLEPEDLATELKKSLSKGLNALWPYFVDRREEARNFLAGLPMHYVPGFAYRGDDGMTVADPDPFIRHELILDRRQLMGAGSEAD